MQYHDSMLFFSRAPSFVTCSLGHARAEIKTLTFFKLLGRKQKEAVESENSDGQVFTGYS